MAITLKYTRKARGLFILSVLGGFLVCLGLLMVLIDSPQERAFKHIVLAQKIETILQEGRLSADRRRVLVDTKLRHYRQALGHQPFNTSLWQAYGRGHGEHGSITQQRQADMIARALKGAEHDQPY